VARFTLDSATEFLFGKCVDSLAEDLPYPFNHHNQASQSSPSANATFIKSFTAAQEITAYRMRFGDHWPLGSFWRDELKQHMKVVHGYIEPIVADVLSKKRENVVPVEKDEETLLENLVNMTEGEYSSVSKDDAMLTPSPDPIILRDEIMNLLVAGRDTVSPQGPSLLSGC